MRGRLDAAERENQIGEELIVEADMVNEQPMGLVAIPCDDRSNDRCVLLGGQAQGIWPLQLVGAIGRKAIVQRARLLAKVLVMGARVDDFVE